MNNPIILTPPAGKAKLEAELAELKGPKRDEISRRLKSAIEMGDLSENADYHAAKEDQGFLEGGYLKLRAFFRARKSPMIRIWITPAYKSATVSPFRKRVRMKKAGKL